MGMSVLFCFAVSFCFIISLGLREDVIRRILLKGNCTSCIVLLLVVEANQLKTPKRAAFNLGQF